jgi:hypothetical protein
MKNQQSKKIKKIKPKRCPMCGKMTFITSVFGSICSDEKCFYEEKAPRITRFGIKQTPTRKERTIKDKIIK